MDPVTRPTRIADCRVSPPTFAPATLIRNFPPVRLADVEASWAPERQELTLALQRAGTVFESSHWDWRRKIERVRDGELILHAIECEGEVQGLMATDARPRAAQLNPGHQLVYIDYIEAAPWNQRAPVRPLRFGGVGSALFTEAVILSTESGFAGRIGLHSLSQAEGFYTRGCEMTNLGRDAGYFELVYFEYDVRAAHWLATRNTE